MKISQIEAAKLLGVDRRTVQRWSETGKLRVHSTTVGGHRRYMLEDVECLAQERKSQSASSGTGGNMSSGTTPPSAASDGNHSAPRTLERDSGDSLSSFSAERRAAIEALLA